jgi:hypothetical protein
VYITLAGEGVVQYLSRTGDEGADWEWYLVSQKLVRSDTFRRLADLLCVGGSADCGLDKLVGLIPYICGKLGGIGVGW